MGLFKKRPVVPKDWSNIPVEVVVEIHHFPQGWDANLRLWGYGPQGCIVREIRVGPFAARETLDRTIDEKVKSLVQAIRDCAVLDNDHEVLNYVV